MFILVTDCSGALGAGLAIFSRFPIASATTRPYSLNGAPTDVKAGDWFVGKAAACAVIKHPQLGEVDVYNTHVRPLHNNTPLQPSLTLKSTTRLAFRQRRRRRARAQPRTQARKRMGVLEIGQDIRAMRSIRDCSAYQPFQPEHIVS